LVVQRPKMEDPVETDPTRAIEWMIGLPDITFLASRTDWMCGPDPRRDGVPPVGCPGCGVSPDQGSTSGGTRRSPVSGRPICLVCTSADGAVRIRTARRARGPRRTTHRVPPPGPEHACGVVVTFQSAVRTQCERGGHRTRCGWRTVNHAVITYAKRCSRPTKAVRSVAALGLDEVLMVRMDRSITSTSPRRSSTSAPANCWTSSWSQQCGAHGVAGGAGTSLP